MKKVVLFDPAVGSINMGDHIISQGAQKQLGFLLEDAFVVSVSTHLPVSLYMRHFSDSSFRFALGSNLLSGRIGRLRPHWDVRRLQSFLLAPIILVGVGWRGYRDNPTRYAASLYRSILAKDQIHSVRDEFTANQLRHMGIENVVNTACATMWDLTATHCAAIPSKKASQVITTLTDYNRDPGRDRRMLEILLDAYDEVSVWIQGYQDYEYLRQLQEGLPLLKVIPPDLRLFDAALQDEDVDYVGTRLHGGIRALQHKRRAIVVAIDNRAIEKQRDFNLVCIRRNAIEGLRDMVLGEFETQIRIPSDNIKLWKKQFAKASLSPAEGPSSRVLRGIDRATEIYRSTRDRLKPRAEAAQPS